ncbi:hypothetical protein [Myxococcus sp. AM011]|nr:hypothetical protein [Myxococcus sp. AM011]
MSRVPALSAVEMFGCLGRRAMSDVPALSAVEPFDRHHHTVDAAP